MASNLPSSGTSTLLTMGNVVTIGLQLYLRHAREYLKLGLMAILWLLLPLVGTIGVLIVASQGQSPGLIVLSIVLGAAGFTYGAAKYLAISAAISRRSFCYLNQQAESIDDTRRYVDRRMWGFWRIAFFQSLLFLAVVIGVYIFTALLLVFVLFGVGGASIFQGDPEAFSDPQTAMLIGLISIVFFVVLLAGMGYLLAWLTARFMISEMGYAVEEDTPALSSLGRSWRLTRRNARRIMLGIMMVFLASLPIQVVLQLLIGAASAGLTLALPDDAIAYTPLLMLVSYSLSIGVSVVLLPLWQAIKAVLYYDLTERREGRSLDLSVSDRPGTPSVQPWLNHVTLLTPESVELDFTLAGVGNRSWALVLDYIFLIGGLMMFWLLWGWMSTALLDWIEDLGFAYDSAWIWVLAITFLITFIIFTGYFVLFETLWQGQTPGKRIMHIRVIQDNGQPVTLGQTTLRALLRPIDDLLLIGALFIALGKREKRLGDWVAGTQVIQEDYADPRLKLEISPSAGTLARKLSPSMHLDRLSPDQFVTLREYLQRRLMIDTQIQKELRLELARQAKELVQLEQVPEGVSADQFLEALYVAYQRQSDAR